MSKKNAELKEEVVTPEVIDDSPKAPESPAEAMIAPLTLYDQKLVEFSPYKDLTINGLGDKEGYKKVDAARKEVKRTKIEVEKVADSILDPIVKLAQQVRDKKKEYIKGFLSIEKDLEAKVDDYDRQEKEEKARIEAEAEARYNKRMDQLFTLGAKFNGHTSYKVGEIAVTSQEIKTLSDEKFIEITGLMEVEAELIREQERKEEERLAEEKRLREEEAERQRQEAEKLRQEKEQLEKEKAEMQAQLQKEKEELESQLKAAREEAAGAERERIRKEREAEQERVRVEGEARRNKRYAEFLSLNENIIEVEGDLSYKNKPLLKASKVEALSEDEWIELMSLLPDQLAELEVDIANEEFEKSESLRLATESAIAAEKAAAEREEMLKPDKQKLTDAAGRIKDFPTKLAFTSPEAKAIHERLTVKMEEVAAWLSQSVETL